jgi:hypothetical protein
VKILSCRFSIRSHISKEKMGKNIKDLSLSGML